MILILNPNTTQATTDAMVAIATQAVPDLVFSGQTAAFGAPVITTAEALATGADAVAAMGADLPEGVRGVIVAAFGDPGIAALRVRLSCPVVGIGEASLLEASAGGRRFGIATTTPGLDGSIAGMVAGHGLAGQFTGCRYTSGDPAGILADPEALAEALALAVTACLADGAEAVIIGGGPLARAARTLAPRFAVPIVEPLPAASRLMRARLG